MKFMDRVKSVFGGRSNGFYVPEGMAADDFEDAIFVAHTAMKARQNGEPLPKAAGFKIYDDTSVEVLKPSNVPSKATASRPAASAALTPHFRGLR